VALALGVLFAPSTARSEFTVTGTRLQERVNAALSLMQYNLAPEITASSLSISGGEAGTTGLSMGAFGGGFTWSKSFPLYLEGNLAYTRYDPTFVITDGAVQRQLPVKWNSLSGTVGVGWDFPLARELTLRPMANFSLGRVTSDIVIAGRIIEGETGREIEFLDNGHLDAVGYGGSLMLDYEHHREMYEIDVETRLTNIRLESFGGTSEAVEGSVLAQTLGVWARWRAPTGLRALDRPVRYVNEFAYSYYFGPNGDMLGFNHLTSLGVGIELDTEAFDRIVTRWRLLARYRFGENVTGWSFGLGMSF
jgi:Autotransporter beta-domain